MDPNPQYDGLTVPDILDLIPEDFDHTFLLIVDRDTLAKPDHAVLVSTCTTRPVALSGGFPASYREMKPSMAPVSIERLTIGHGERLRAIRLRALRDAPEAFAATLDESAARPVETWDRQLEQLATFVAASHARDVGLVRGAPHDNLPNAAYLISMWVAPEARRQGIGLALIQHVIAWARAEGRDRLFLDVGEYNAPAIALYRRSGFVLNGEESTLVVSGKQIREVRLVLQLT